MLYRMTFVISSLSSGGAERQLTTMANYWAERGGAITILTFDNGTQAPFFALHPSIVHRPLCLTDTSSNSFQAVINNIKRIIILRRAIKGNAPQVVISFMDQTNVLTLMATIGMDLPVIVSERTNPYDHAIGKPWKLLRILIYVRARFLIVQTRRALIYFPGFIMQRARVIANPVAPPEDASYSKRARRTGKRTIAAMGRLGKEKGFDLLLMAFNTIYLRYPDWSLTIYGDGPLRNELAELGNKLALAGRVHFPGRTGKPYEALCQAEIFVLPSRYEGFPNALCEAMACGLPVVSFDCPNGPREIIRNRIDGILIPPGDIGALALALEELIQNEEYRMQLGERAREIVQRFSIEEIVGQWERVIEEALALPVRET